MAAGRSACARSPGIASDLGSKHTRSHGRSRRQDSNPREPLYGRDARPLSDAGKS